MKVGVIGAGIGGIAAAIRLRLLGHEVDVYENNSYPGGKLSEINIRDFRFDAGPSLFTLPNLVDELFELAGENPQDHFKYIRLPVSCKYFFEDRTTINMFDDREQLLKEIREKTGERPKRISKALKHSERLYNTLSGLFLHRSLHDWRTWFNLHAFKAYLRLPLLRFWRTLNGLNQSRFKDPKIVQIFNRFATYNGSNPYQTPATMTLIPHLELNLGAYFPEKGMNSITQSLFDLAKRLGVNFYFNKRVEKLIINELKVKGIQCDQYEEYYDIVVSNMDVHNTYIKLMPEMPRPDILKKEKSSSAVIFYWAIKKKFSQLDLHNIFFTKNYEEEFNYIFKQKKIYKDPTVYINITSKYKKDDAPENCENWFVMINVPSNIGEGHDWDQMVAEARKNVIRKISGILDLDIANYIIGEEVLDPIKIEFKTSSSGGALYGSSSNSMISSFLRHPNFSSDLENLFFVGGSVHPGGGIPLSLLSAKITTNLIQDTFSG